MTIRIETATAADEGDWRRLWADYLRYYGVELSPDVTDRTWARTLDPASPLTARLARKAGGMVGFAMHHHHASTWAPGDDCYLEDLFVAEAARGMGVGRALIDDLMTIARTKGWHRLYWHADAANTAARRLYDSYVLTDGHIRYRFDL